VSTCVPLRSECSEAAAFNSSAGGIVTHGAEKHQQRRWLTTFPDSNVIRGVSILQAHTRSRRVSECAARVVGKDGATHGHCLSRMGLPPLESALERRPHCLYWRSSVEA
jgi:hypothetical protein